MKTKVLIVDDSAVVRNTLKKELGKADDIEVVGAAPDPYVAREMIIKLKPDVITLDIEMPRMDGITFLKKLMKHHPIPIIILSSIAQKGSQAALEAARFGAIDVVAKPDHAYSLGDVTKSLIDKIRQSKHVNLKRLAEQADSALKVSPASTALVKATNTMIIVGASTGGTAAIETFLQSFPLNSPGILITQHMPAGFTKSFSERLNSVCTVEVREAKQGDIIAPGKAFVAPGGFHMLIKRSGATFTIDIKDTPPVGNHKPSVDVLFHSAARSLGPNAIGVILTGMGGDGADGMKAMKDAGAYNFAQDENTSVVYGMPKVAVEKGGVDEILPLGKIGPSVIGRLGKK